MAIQLTVMSLDFESSGGPITKVVNKEQVYLGRDSTNDMVLARPEVSKRHAMLRVERNGAEQPTMYITDLGSSNGTMVESKNLEPELEVEILPDQRIIIGNYLIKTSYVDQEPEDLFSAEEEEEIEVSALSNAETAKVERPEQEVEMYDLAVEDERERVEEEAEEETEAVPARQPLDEEDTMGFIDLEPRTEVKDYEETVLTGESGEDAPPTEDYEPSSLRETSAASAVRTISVDGDNVVDLDFSAARLYTLRGSVKRRGEGLSGVKVSDALLGETVTDSTGEFVFTDVEEDTAYKLSAEKDGYKLDCSLAEGVVHEDAMLSITALKLVTLSGKVAHKGVPLEGVEIDGGVLGKTTTGSDGVYRFENVLEGEKYTITASKNGFVLKG